MTPHDDDKHLNDILEMAHTAAREFLNSLPTRPAGRAHPPLPPDRLPDEGIGAVNALAAFRETYEPWLSASPGPRYLGFVTGGTTPAALAGDWLVSIYDQNVVSSGDSVATQVERATVGLLRTLFGLPESFEGVFVTGATQANAVALATARQWAASRLGIEQSSHFDLLAPVRLNIVCFALRGADTARRDRFLAALTADGRVLLTPTVFADTPAIREQDIPLILDVLEQCAGA